MIDTAIILAGGLGTRLRPLTEETPKPLLPLRGKPILQHIIEQLARKGVKKIILSIGYKAAQIRQYFGDGSRFGVTIQYVIEAEPLGTGGAVKEAARSLTEPFFLVWADNLTDIDFQQMIHEIRASPQYKMWREAIFTRDNFTCTWCLDKRGGNLQADHIKPFIKFVIFLKSLSGIVLIFLISRFLSYARIGKINKSFSNR